MQPHKSNISVNEQAKISKLPQNIQSIINKKQGDILQILQQPRGSGSSRSTQIVNLIQANQTIQGDTLFQIQRYAIDLVNEKEGY